MPKKLSRALVRQVTPMPIGPPVGVRSTFESVLEDILEHATEDQLMWVVRKARSRAWAVASKKDAA